MKTYKPGVYSQAYLQLIFAVKHRDALLTDNIRSHIFEYIAGIINSLKHKPILVNGVADHVHILIGINPNVSFSDTVSEIKRGSSLHINKNNLCPSKFAWQEGYAAFTYSKSQIDKVYKYILNQEQHHTKRLFKDEYLDILKKYEIEYDEKYVFDFFN